jgi:hypothetical protein
MDQGVLLLQTERDKPTRDVTYLEEKGAITQESLLTYRNA